MSNERTAKLVSDATMRRVSRRDVLKGAAALGLSATVVSSAAARTGVAAPASTTARRAPAFLQGTKMTILQASYFVAPGQDFYTQRAQEWGKQNNVEVTTDYVNWPDLQPKIGAAVQGGSGPDIIEMWDTWPYLYYQNMLPMDDLASKVAQSQGNYFDWVTTTAAVDGKWYSVPHGTSSSAFVYRTSYLQEVGATEFPKTWEELFTIGKKLKAMGKPIGQAFGHSLGDPPSFAYPFMWAYGAMEVQEDGKTVAFNAPQFVDGMKLFLQGWKDAFLDTGLSWDDAANNRAYLSDQISCTLNGSSIYITAQNPDPSKGNPAIAQDTNHAGYPSGPAGRFNALGSRSFGVMKYSKNAEAAKSFLDWWFAPEQFQPWLEAQKGYIIPPVPSYVKNPIYTTDPKLAAYLDVVNYGRNKGYAGPANQNAALSSSKYIVVDTFAQAVQSGDAEGAIKRGAEQLQRVYGA